MGGRRLSASLAGVAVASAVLSGCQDPGPETEGTPDAVRAISLPAGPGGYCEVQGLRALVADGIVAMDALPRSADFTEVDGTPRIVDYTTSAEDGRSNAEVRDELFSSPGLRDVDVPRSYRTPCLWTTTDADVVRTQGDVGYGPAPEEKPEPSPGPKEQVPSLGESLGAYCMVQSVRELIDDGSLTLGGFPDDVDTTAVEGTPRLVDFTTAPEGTDHWRLADEVIESVPGAPEVLEDSVRTCMAETTDTDVETTQGAPGFRSS